MNEEAMLKSLREWAARPVPVYDEFNVDWKKLREDGSGEAERIHSMIPTQTEKLNQTYPNFDFSKAAWPTENSADKLSTRMSQYLVSFQNAERWAISRNK